MKKGMILTVICLCLWARSAAALVDYRDTNRFVNGFGKVLIAPFYIPTEIIRQTFSQYPTFGTISGAISGVSKTVFTLISGIFDMAGAAAPYAKYALPFL